MKWSHTVDGIKRISGICIIVTLPILFLAGVLLGGYGYRKSTFSLLRISSAMLILCSLMVLPFTLNLFKYYFDKESTHRLVNVWRTDKSGSNIRFLLKNRILCIIICIFHLGFGFVPPTWTYFSPDFWIWYENGLVALFSFLLIVIISYCLSTPLASWYCDDGTGYLKYIRPTTSSEARRYFGIVWWSVLIDLAIAFFVVREIYFLTAEGRLALDALINKIF